MNFRACRFVRWIRDSTAVTASISCGGVDILRNYCTWSVVRTRVFPDRKFDPLRKYPACVSAVHAARGVLPFPGHEGNVPALGAGFVAFNMPSPEPSDGIFQGSLEPGRWRFCHVDLSATFAKVLVSMVTLTNRGIPRDEALDFCVTWHIRRHSRAQDVLTSVKRQATDQAVASARSVNVVIRVRPRERQRWKDAAADADETLSEWIRVRLNQHAGSEERGDK